jgi:hypothetical protein
MASIRNSIEAPSSAPVKPDRIRKRKVRGESVTEVRCRFCDVWQPVDREHFFVFRAIDGAFHLNSRCRNCEKSYRTNLRHQIGAGNHRPKPRPRHRDEAAAEAATAQKTHPGGGTTRRAVAAPKAAAKPKRQRQAKADAPKPEAVER